MLSSSKPSEQNPLPIPTGFTTYSGEELNESLLDGLAAVIHRMTGKGLQQAKALARWSDELVVHRDVRGAIAGVHGFRFSNAGVGRTECRVVYVIFSAQDRRALDRQTASRQVGTQVYSRQRNMTPRVPVVWVNGPGSDVGVPFPGDSAQPPRRLAIRAASSVPQNIHFYTDQPAGENIGGTVPLAVENATAMLIQQQRNIESHAQTGHSTAPSWRKVTTGLVGVATAAAALMLMTRTHPMNDGAKIDSPVFRTKGGANLHVFRQKGEDSEEIANGARVSPGDRVRFAVDLPTEQRISVVGVEANGRLYVAWPQPGVSGGGVLAAGTGQSLPGAVAFDSSIGREALFLVSCPPSFAEPLCTSRGAGVDPQCPSQCSMTPFTVQKAN